MKEKKTEKIHIPSLKTRTTECGDGRRRRIYTRPWINPLGLHGRFSTTKRIKRISCRGTDTIGATETVDTGRQDRDPPNEALQMRPPNGPSDQGPGPRRLEGLPTTMLGLCSALRGGNFFFWFFAGIIVHSLRNFIVFLLLLIIATS
ncbi:uncharacterized protein BDW47DRAFT_10232 [Aspergillus candidus]|uniref:Uncharacterized protein n=1 Tax=Aspergillus candidus TaxID=41067 RepID=A0A2I2EXL6_ASPCN|nr:hypothetical protein BDW47DRAFT_10232 [Aspergillus candidus]PLB33110.1 hypothetical protein BDW47DRAFT_10232 [Aspergillus candidus]